MMTSPSSTYPPYTYAIIDAARDYSRIALAQHCCIWSDSLFEGPGVEDLDDVAPHLFACDFEGTVAWLTLRGHYKGEAGIVVESSLSFKKLRRELRKRLHVWREQSKRTAFFRFYDPRVLRAFLPACTPEELVEFFGPIDSFNCQSENKLQVLSFSISNSGELKTEESHMDDFLVAKGYCSQTEIDQAKEELPEIRKQQLGEEE